jgi:hypothetical protein
MFDCKNINKWFLQDVISTKTRKISEIILFDRHHSCDQSKKSNNLSIEMLN